MKRFLVIQTAFIGDVILATPVISELKRIYPESKIDLLVRKGNEKIVANNPNLHEVFTFNKKEGKIASMFALIKEFRKKKYDEIINLQRFASSGIIAAFSGAKKVIGFKKNPLSMIYSIKLAHEIGNNLHEVERNLSCIHHHGAKKIVRPEVFPSEKDYAFVKGFQGTTYFCLAPASVWFTKQLPEQKWVDLGKKLQKIGTVYLIGGPGDTAFCEKINKQIASENCLNLAGKFSFLQSAALFQGAKMNYVNDSGPLHFCSAVNAPVTAYFCSTVPAFGFGPLSEVSKIVETKENLSCRPCGLHGFKTCPKGHFACGNGIDV